MDFRLLGELEIEGDRGPVRLSARKQRALLLLLLLHRGELLSRGLLVDQLWVRPPDDATHALEVQVSRLRKTLREAGMDDLLVTRPGGYALMVADEHVDLARVEHLIAQAERALAARDLRGAVADLKAALASWRGEPLAELSSEPFADAEIARLEELRLGAIEALAEARLQLGEQLDLLPELERLVIRHPLRERLRAQLMLALYLAGRQADALEVYQAGRRLMVDELGLEPSPELQQLQQKILRHDPTLGPLPAEPSEPPPPTASPTAPTTAAPSSRIERKTVTVLFADVSGSTALGEQLDPELLREVMLRYFGEIEAAIACHGGTVEKFVGDAAMAIFGLPVAHEDDALRAVRAAAEIRERLPRLAEETGVELVFRIGVNSGEVVAGSGEATLATGDAINVAARLQQAAEPGEILLGAETARLLGPLLEAELLPPLELRGKGEPVEASRFVRLLPREERPRTRFVGRTHELALLQAALRRAIDTDSLQLFTLLGPAGIGKSRIASEFAARLTDAQIARGRCLSYGQALSYWPLVEVLRALGKPAAPAVETLVEGGASSPQQLAWTVQTALEQAADERPLVVVLDDLHWADEPLLDLIDRIADLSRGAPILLLCLARPELLDQRPGWAGGKLNASSVLLEPLPASECADLLGELEPELERPRRRRILELAAGNPLFLEELAALAAEGSEELPPRIHALLQARLDRLPASERRVLACAAVEGLTFHRSNLAALVPNHLRGTLPTQLDALTRKDMLRPERHDPDGDGYRFRHQLIRDTAYAAVPKKERADLHARMADLLERDVDARAELAELAALHLEQAALTRRELSARDVDLDDRAAAALAAAAVRARDRPDLTAAATLWQRALRLLDPNDPDVPELELDLALVLQRAGQLEEALRLADDVEQRTDDPTLTATARLAALLARWSSDPEGIAAAIRSECARAIPLFEQHRDDRRLGIAWEALGMAEWSLQHVEATASAWANAAEHAHRAGDRERELLCTADRLHILATNQPLEAVIAGLEELERRFPGEPNILIPLTGLRAEAALHARRFDDARELDDEAIELTRAAGYTTIAATEIGTRRAEIELFAGDLDEAERLTHSAIAELEHCGDRGYLSATKTYLAEIQLTRGRADDALRLTDEAERLAAPDDRFTVVAACTIRARALARLGDVGEARAAAAQAAAAAEATDSLRLHATAHHALAEALAIDADELGPACAAAERAAHLYAQLGLTLRADQATELTRHIKSRPAAPSTASSTN